MLNEGKYMGRAVNWTLARSSKKGTPEVAIAFDVFGDDGHVVANRTFHGYLSDDVFPRTIEVLRVCGWTGDDLSNLTGLDQNEVELEIRHEEYEGKVSDRIAFVNQPGRIAVQNPMDEVDAKSFAAQMRGKIVALGGKAQKPKRQGTDLVPPIEDEPPF